MLALESKRMDAPFGAQQLAFTLTFELPRFFFRGPEQVLTRAVEHGNFAETHFCCAGHEGTLRARMGNRELEGLPSAF